MTDHNIDNPFLLWMHIRAQKFSGVISKRIAVSKLSKIYLYFWGGLHGEFASQYFLFKSIVESFMCGVVYKSTANSLESVKQLPHFVKANK